VIQLDSRLRRVDPQSLGASPHLVGIPTLLDLKILNEISLVLNLDVGLSLILLARGHCGPQTSDERDRTSMVTRRLRVNLACGEGRVVR
jgi:hypothetical protein